MEEHSQWELPNQGLNTLQTQHASSKQSSSTFSFKRRHHREGEKCWNRCEQLKVEGATCFDSKVYKEKKERKSSWVPSTLKGCSGIQSCDHQVHRLTKHLEASTTSFGGPVLTRTIPVPSALHLPGLPPPQWTSCVPGREHQTRKRDINSKI